MNPDYFIILLAVALSLDCFSISLITSIYKCPDIQKASKLALVLAFFQALMFLAGWFLGKWIFSMLGSAEAMIASSIVIVIGIKKLFAAFSLKHDERSFNIDLNIILFGLAIATSIDSFITSLGSEYLGIAIKKQIIFIYILSVIFSLAGSYTGKKLVCKTCPKISIVIGGIIMLFLGGYKFLLLLKIF